jgi:hypothetical protein
MEAISRLAADDIPPRHADPTPGGYVVRDANGRALVYLYSRDNEDEARQAIPLGAIAR